ncbi:tyrosine-type recombinase/integrase [Burkholderia gladioli]|uniref:tyrosine-type recombinase/integrase n=1 Tax=Burkholderia gladioli TaxID=28095 RepID=UPI001641117A|nr:site-specific integrase [Burkholderia gladioli]
MAQEYIRSKTARSKLVPQREPYWELLTTGLSVGYRKTNSGGSWIGRRKGDDGKYQFRSFGGGLEFDEARSQVQNWHNELSLDVVHDKKKMTVADVCRSYVENRRKEKGEKTAYDAEKRFERLVYPVPFGKIVFSKLKFTNVKTWRDDQLDAHDPYDELSYNKARDSVNRELKSLKAALNYGREVLRLVSSDNAWKKVNQFKNVAARRQGLLSKEQRSRLLDAMSSDLRVFASALLLTGARPGEVAAANASDFSREGRTLALDGKTGRRVIPLSDQVFRFFSEQAQNKIGNAPLFSATDGQRWVAPMWGRMFRDAREKSGLPDAVLYCMRHTYISEAIAQGVDVFTVATLTGTSVEVIQSNYGSLTPNVRDRLNQISIL